MRIERWYWLGVFCLFSLLIHAGALWRSRHLGITMPVRPEARELEVALEPPVEPRSAAKKPVPEPKTPGPKAAPRPAARPERQRVAAASLPRPHSARPDVSALPRVAPPRPAKHLQGGDERLKDERPIAFGLPVDRSHTQPPRLQTARLDLNPGGGGSPAPGRTLGGHGGTPGPEAPPDTIVWNGGGRGGADLPQDLPRMGGGGGNSVLSVSNPLGKAVPEERPGAGPGIGGGQGYGAGAGYGASRGSGYGASTNGRQALAALSRSRGPGIGNASGAGIGNRQPGGGRGAGAEAPGTGGLGIGYGRGSGVGVGDGSGIGVGDGAGGAPPGRMRGVPFGDVTGLLKGGSRVGGGGQGGGPGGLGRGVVFSPASAGGRGGAAVNIIYCLDTSGSMRDNNKIGKAKEALKKALNELQPRDSFNIIAFDNQLYMFAQAMQKASGDNVKRACDYVDGLQMHDYTHLSDALDTALGMEKVTHIFVLSDGEPHGGIEDFGQLAAMVRGKNSRHVHINTMALGLGQSFPGMRLFRTLADENGGQFVSVDLSK